MGPSVPRDAHIILGNTILEAPMSLRARYFEFLAFRDIIYDVWNKDRRVRWLACPKPTMADSMYNDFFAYDKSKEERMKRYQKDFRICVNEDEIVFDAADMMKCGKDVFIRFS